MRKTANVLIVIGLVTLALACIFGIFSIAGPRYGTRWRLEPTPPEKLTRLEVGNAGEIIAYTSDGAMYEFSYGSPSSWEKVTQPSGIPAIGMDCTPSETTNRTIVPPPGKEISRAIDDCGMYETAFHLEVVLLENGEVWSWEHESYAYTVLFIMALLFIAVVIGSLILLVGVGIKIYQKLKNG